MFSRDGFFWQGDGMGPRKWFSHDSGPRPGSLFGLVRKPRLLRATLRYHAIAVYTNYHTHGQYYPDVQVVNYGTDHYWWSEISPYLEGKATCHQQYGKLKVLQCPVQTEKIVNMETPFTLSFWNHEPSYGMSRLLGRRTARVNTQHHKVRLAQVRRVRNTVCVSEASYHGTAVLTSLTPDGPYQAACVAYPCKGCQSGVPDGASNIIMV